MIEDRRDSWHSLNRPITPSLRGWGKTVPYCYPEPFGVILSAAKDLALRIFMNNARFFVASGFSEWETQRVFPQPANRSFSPGMGKGGVLTPPLPTFLTVSPSRTPRSPALAGLRGARDEPEAGSRFAAVPPCGTALPVARLKTVERGEKSGLNRPMNP
jgi:hypothetical protein